MPSEIPPARLILRWNAAGQRVMPFGYGGQLPDALALTFCPTAAS